MAGANAAAAAGIRTLAPNAQAALQYHTTNLGSNEPPTPSMLLMRNITTENQALDLVRDVLISAMVSTAHVPRHEPYRGQTLFTYALNDVAQAEIDKARLTGIRDYLAGAIAKDLVSVMRRRKPNKYSEPGIATATPLSVELGVMRAAAVLDRGTPVCPHGILYNIGIRWYACPHARCQTLVRWMIVNCKRARNMIWKNIIPKTCTMRHMYLTRGLISLGSGFELFRTYPNGTIPTSLLTRFQPPSNMTQQVLNDTTPVLRQQAPNVFQNLGQRPQASSSSSSTTTLAPRRPLPAHLESDSEATHDSDQLLAAILATTNESSSLSDDSDEQVSDARFATPTQSEAEEEEEEKEKEEPASQTSEPSEQEDHSEEVDSDLPCAELKDTASPSQLWPNRCTPSPQQTTPPNAPEPPTRRTAILVRPRAQRRLDMPNATDDEPRPAQRQRVHAESLPENNNTQMPLEVNYNTPFGAVFLLTPRYAGMISIATMPRLSITNTLGNTPSGYAVQLHGRAFQDATAEPRTFLLARVARFNDAQTYMHRVARALFMNNNQQ